MTITVKMPEIIIMVLLLVFINALCLLSHWPNKGSYHTIQGTVLLRLYAVQSRHPINNGHHFYFDIYHEHIV
jgi:hypothetical protein